MPSRAYCVRVLALSGITLVTYWVHTTTREAAIRAARLRAEAEKLVGAVGYTATPG